MTRLICCTVFALFLMPAIVGAQDFHKGVAAAKAGDFAMAISEWKPLAEMGNVWAQFNIGLMYNKGTGVPQDYSEAAKWFRMAAERGEPKAQFNLGNKYVNGQGVSQDYVEALKWYRLAADQGDANAQANLGVMRENGWGVPQDFIVAHMWYNLSAGNGYEFGRIRRDSIAESMTDASVAEAQRRARVCMASNYKDCD
jgi:uncharacterized protein